MVAEEIRKLADATHTYSGEISAITSNVTNSSKSAVNSIDEVSEVVEESVNIADLTKNPLMIYWLNWSNQYLNSRNYRSCKGCTKQ